MMRKHRLERDIYRVDFNAVLDEDETLVSVEVFRLIDPRGVDATLEFRADEPEVTVGERSVAFWLGPAELEADQSQQRYDIVCLVLTSTGRRLLGKDRIEALPALHVSKTAPLTAA